MKKVQYEDQKGNINQNSVGAFLGEKGFTHVSRFNRPSNKPFCYHDKNSVVVFDFYRHGGMSAPPSTLTMIVLSPESSKLIEELENEFPCLPDLKLENQE